MVLVDTDGPYDDLFGFGHSESIWRWQMAEVTAGDEMKLLAVLLARDWQM